MTGPLLSLNHVSHRFAVPRDWPVRARQKTALHDISFTLDRGRTLAVVGEGGSGKSTLARVIAGLLKPSEGEVRFNGIDMYTRERELQLQLRRHVRMVFQNPNASLNPRTTIGQQLELALQHLTQLGPRQRIERINEALSKVGLQADHKDHYPHQFSTGQRQRVAIARAIMLNPQLIVADEPISTLDASVQAQIMNLMLDLQDTLGLSYVLISNDLAIAKVMSDQIMVMYAGEIMEYGPVETVYETPLHPYTRALFAASPSIRDVMKVSSTPLRGELGSAGMAAVGCPLSRRCPFADEHCKTARPERRLMEQQLVFCHKAGEV